MEGYEDFDLHRWAALRTATPPVLPDGDMDVVARQELLDVYAPLAELIVQRASVAGLGEAPFVVSVVGSVAVGKSTAARALRTMLEVGATVTVDLVGTDGFLLPNRVLAARGLTERKGFPETFDLEMLSRFLRDVKAGRPEVRAPRYSHVVYDVTGEEQVVRRPDVLILEGLPLAVGPIDLSIYVDADEADIEDWFVARFLALRREALDDDASFFRHFTGFSEEQTAVLARQVWTAINGVNLHEHILPVRDRCDVIIEKVANHSVQRVRLRSTSAAPRSCAHERNR